MQTRILVGLFFCHLLADFTPLSTGWMLHAKQLGKPVFPIFIHAFIHAFLMSVLLALVFGLSGSKLADLFFFQLITHFLIDVCKGRMNGWFPTLQNTANKWHWILFGADQYLHTLVIILMSHWAVT